MIFAHSLMGTNTICLLLVVVKLFPALAVMQDLYQTVVVRRELSW